MHTYSKSFKHGNMIPQKYTCDGDDTNPHLAWEAIPNAKSYAITCVDPDASIGTVVHWLVYYISPTMTEINENIKNINNINNKQNKNILQGINSHDEKKYLGSCPPKGEKAHRYFFNIYALDISLKEKKPMRLQEFCSLIYGHIIATGEITGLYKR